MLSRKLKYPAFAVIVVILGLLAFHGPILTGAGRFMAPTSDTVAEVLIVEGEAVVKTGAVNAAINLMKQGRANRMVVVLQYPPETGRVFALQEKYSQLIVDEVVRLGLKREYIDVVWAPVAGHPITLSEARYVAGRLAKEGARSAILLSNAFHTRRSWGVYRQEGSPLGLKVTPYAHFNDYDAGSWWEDVSGVGAFVEETAKLVYYLARGYLSVKYVF